MKAAVFQEPNKILIKETDKPSLSENGAIIKVKGCGLCGSDIVKFNQQLVKTGAVLGHEVVGEITELKTTNTHFKIGDKVVLGHHVPCFNCVYCKNKNFSMCHEFKSTNIFPGGFAEYIFASEAHLNNTVAKIPSNLTDIQASYMEPSACCLRAVRRADVKPGDNVIIVGLGSIGMLIGQIAKHFGANVTGFDLLDERLKLAKKVGFDHAIKFENNEDSSDFYKKATHSFGADKVFLASGASSSLPFSLACVRDGGTILVFASVKSYEDGFANNDIYYRELTVMGSYSPSPTDLHDSLELIQKGIIKVDNFASVYALDNISEAIKDTLSNKIFKAFIKISD